MHPVPATAPDRLPLTRERVLDAAVAYADEHGVAALSMRKLAAELGFEVMSLYNHVANKNDLLDGMLDQVVDAAECPGDEIPWREAIRRHAITFREALQAHPWAVSLVAVRLPGPIRIAQLEWQLATYARSGLSDVPRLARR